MHKILVIDDEEECLEALKGLLSKNFNVITAIDGEEGVKKVLEELPDLVLIDIQMPKLDGIGVCKKIRKETTIGAIPIIMVSATADEVSRTESFLWGADDFIAKPFSGRELMARVMAKLCWDRKLRGDGSEVTTHKIGNLTIDRKRYEALLDGTALSLTNLEFRLLNFFVENSQQLLAREKLLKNIWNDAHVSSRTVDTHIYGLRRKLASFDHEISTIHGTGYILKPR